MLMTAKQARRTYCPTREEKDVLVQLIYVVTNQELDRSPTASLCRGPECPHWRWYDCVTRDLPALKVHRQDAPTEEEIRNEIDSIEDSYWRIRRDGGFVTKEGQRAVEKYIADLTEEFGTAPETTPEYVPEGYEYQAPWEGEDDAEFIGWIEPADALKQRMRQGRRGFCGLSGKPTQEEE